MTLHGPKGDINGALLDDGAIVRLPSPEAARFAALLSPGQTISVEGDVNASVLGRVIDATAIGASSATLNPVDAPPRLPRPGWAGGAVGCSSSASALRVSEQERRRKANGATRSNADR